MSLLLDRQIVMHWYMKSASSIWNMQSKKIKMSNKRNQTNNCYCADFFFFVFFLLLRTKIFIILILSNRLTI